MRRPPLPLKICPGAFLLVLASTFLFACTTVPSPRRQVAGAFGDLPDIQLVNPGSSRTPPHNMSMSEYPFDSAGNYISGIGR